MLTNTSKFFKLLHWKTSRYRNLIHQKSASYALFSILLITLTWLHLFLSLAFFSFSLSWRLIHFSQVRFLSVGVNGRQHIVQWTLVHREFIFLIAVIFYFIIRSVKEMHKSCHHIFYMLDLLSSSARVFIYDCSSSLMIYMFSWRHITIKLFL